ncbi:MAG: polysaccharide deacetylase family protein [Leptospiraceae bacterium]|nr:polysaccharide deacetylase family protein [Leptospiraceae bacterium]
MMRRRVLITIPVFLLCLGLWFALGQSGKISQWLGGGGPHQSGYNLVPILCFHDVNGSGPYSVTIEEFRNYLDILKKENIRIVPLKEVMQHQKDNRLMDQPTMAITVDDDFENIARVAAPILREYDFPATFFVYTKDINTHPHGGMAWEDLNRLIAEGFEVQNHSHTHTAFHEPRVGESQEHFAARVHQEVVVSRQILEKHLPNHKIWAFAYPMGYYSPYLEEKLREAGYDLILTVDAAPVDVTSKFTGIMDRYTIQKEYVADPMAMFYKQIAYARKKYQSAEVAQVEEGPQHGLK